MCSRNPSNPLRLWSIWDLGGKFYSLTWTERSQQNDLGVRPVAFEYAEAPLLIARSRMHDSGKIKPLVSKA